MLKKLISLPNGGILLIYVAITLVVTYLQQEYAVIPQLRTMPVVDEAIRTKMIEGYYKYRWLMFLLPPALLFLRIFLVSLCLEVGTVFDEQRQLRYKDCWNVTVKADSIKIIIMICSCTMTVFLGAEQASHILNYGSFACLVDQKMIEPWLLVPISSINIFEIIYWLFLSWVFSIQSSKKYGTSFKFVMSTYGVGYLLYIVLLMFLMLYLK